MQCCCWAPPQIIGRYKLLVRGLFAIGIAGAVMLSRMDATTTEPDVTRSMVVTGLGVGGLFTVLTVVAQNAFPDHELGQVSAGGRFFRSFAGTLGAALLGSLLTNRFITALESSTPPALVRDLPPARLAQFQDPQILLEPEAASSLQ